MTTIKIQEKEYSPELKAEYFNNILPNLSIEDKINIASKTKSINTINVLIKDPNEEVRLSLINNPILSKFDKYTLSQDSSLNVVNKINERIEADKKDYFENVLPNLPLEDKIKIATTSKSINTLSVLALDTDKDVQLSVINNPNADLQVITKCNWHTEHDEVIVKANDILKERFPKELDSKESDFEDTVILDFEDLNLKASISKSVNGGYMYDIFDITTKNEDIINSAPDVYDGGHFENCEDLEEMKRNVRLEAENVHSIHNKNVIVFNYVDEIKMRWSEVSDADNKIFKNLDELQDYLKNIYQGERNVPEPNSGYDKNAIDITLRDAEKTDTLKLAIGGGMGRIDISQSSGDFNPFNKHIADYIQEDYNDKSIKNTSEGSYLIDIDFKNPETYKFIETKKEDISQNDVDDFDDDLSDLKTSYSKEEETSKSSNKNKHR